MATALSSTNTYLVSLGGNVGAASIEIPIKTNTLADAQTVAQSLATLFQLPSRLVSTDARSGAENTYTPGSQGSTVSAPSGVKHARGS